MFAFQYLTLAHQLLMQALCSLYGLVRVEKAAAFLLAAGALAGADMAVLRLQINGLCSALAAGGGATAVELCQGFGIPEHIIQVSRELDAFVAAGANRLPSGLRLFGLSLNGARVHNDSMLLSLPD